MCFISIIRNNILLFKYFVLILCLFVLLQLLQVQEEIKLNKMVDKLFEKIEVMVCKCVELIQDVFVVIIVFGED